MISVCFKTPAKGAFAVLLLAALTIPRTAPAADGPGSAEKLQVVAGIIPLADFALQVGGGHVEVALLVTPGQNPHVASLKPSQLALVSRARLLVLNGLGLEFWAERLIEAQNNPGLIVLRCGEGLPKKLMQGSTPPSAKSPAIDPHVWLDPLLAMEQVKCLRDGLIRADPEHGEDYRENSSAYLQRLRLLHEDFTRNLTGTQLRTFFSFHGGYGYLARRYGLREIGVVEGFSDLEPSPARLAQVIRAIRTGGAGVIFAEPQFSDKAAKVIAEETGIEVAYLDPLGHSLEEGYLGMMRKNLTQLRKALKGPE